MNANKDAGKQVFLKLTEEDQLELFGRLRMSWSNTIEVTITRCISEIYVYNKGKKFGLQMVYKCSKNIPVIVL